MMNFLKLYGVGLVVCFFLDLLWLGVLAKDLYARHIGHLMRSDIRWSAGVLFYVLYVAAMVVFVVMPSLEKGSVLRAAGMGAFFGLAAYAAFDLTCLALFRDFPVAIALIDLAWGATLTAIVSATAYGAGTFMGLRG
ncbi:MAG: DUF2177 family protein [Longimicrobiales bacterium]